MPDDDKPESIDLVSEAMGLMSQRDTVPAQEPAERPDPTPPREQEIPITTAHALGLYKSRYCRDLQELLESNSKHRKKRMFGSKEPDPQVIAYIQRSLGMQTMHPFQRIKMVKRAIADTYFRGYEIDSLMKQLDMFCDQCDADQHIYKDRD